MRRRAFLLALAAGTVAATTGTVSASAGVHPRAVATEPPARVPGARRARRSDMAQPPGLGHRHATTTEAATEADTEAGVTGATATDQAAIEPLVAGTAIPAAAAPPAVSPVPTGLPVNLASVPRLITELPGAESTVAITVDDGTSSAVIGAYLDFAEASGVRLTFFLNGINPGWTEHRVQLRRLIESGQVQVGNHTWSHPDITGLSDGALAAEIRRNEKFINDTYGVTGRPFLRPPFGYHNSRTDRVCADLGYTAITMWYGSFGDSSLLSEGQLLALAQQWLTAHRVVIGHANHPTVTHLYPQLLDLIRSRGLTTVTLDDAFFGPAGRDRTNLS